MATRKGKPFSVDTQPSKAVVVEGLTRDATVRDCIFDLIDNAIDAARDTLFQGMPADRREMLPSNYGDFHVQLSLSADGLKIEDNCGGIPVNRLKSMVLRFGKSSLHQMGIGFVGVGLNRALFKLGRVSHLKTDTGKQRSELVLKNSEYLTTDNWELPAEEFRSNGKIGTEIEIRQPPEDISQQFADKDWVEDLRHEIGRRYARFVAKGLSISANTKAARNEEVQLRDGGPYPGDYKFFKTEDGVSIHIQYGQHKDHRFSREPDYDVKRNSAITEQFGWTVLCNDRAILLSDRTDKTGWDTKFHTEFYGFVGYANFICADPSKLPWNTTKTDIDLNNHAYRKALTDMRKFAEKWRAIAEQRKKGPLPQPVPAKSKSSAMQHGSAVKTKRGESKKVVVKPVVKEDHNQFRTVLPGDVNEQHCFDKHLTLVHEGKTLDLADATYSGLALIRMLFESSVVTYMERHGKFAEMKKSAVEQRRKRGVKIDTDAEKKLVPALDEMLPFLQNNPEIWGAAKENYLKHSLTRMSTHQPTLNSAVHNPFQIVGSAKAFEIRNEVLPMLRHLIET